jgi:hypothetical protein
LDFEIESMAKLPSRSVAGPKFVMVCSRNCVEAAIPLWVTVQ